MIRPQHDDSMNPFPNGTNLGPNMITFEPEDTYHAMSKTGKCLSSHMLSDFRRCPLLYKRKIMGLIKEDERPAFLFGRAAHVLILEGKKRFDEEFAVGGPINPKTNKPYGAATQAYADWAAEIGKPVISDSDYIQLEIMANSVRSHEHARKYLQQGEAEVVVRSMVNGIWCQIRIDWLTSSAIVDLKTCDDLSWFGIDARKYGYLNQMAFYQQVHNAAKFGDIPLMCVLIAVEKKEPFRTGVWILTPDSIDVSKQENEIAMEMFCHCVATDSWPTGYEDIREL